MTKFTPLKEIFSLEIDVSELISTENLKEFALTSLVLNNKEVSNSDVIYINYIENLKQYQIILTNNNYKYLPFLVFEQFYDKQNVQIGLDLYLCDNFFCIYKDGLFYFYQAVEVQLGIEEFLEFITRKFNTKINKYVKIEKVYFEELKEKYLLTNKKESLLNINMKKNNSFKFYLLYLFLLVFFCGYFYFDNQKKVLDEDLINSKNIKLEKLKDKYTFISIENDFNNVIENIKFYNLELLFFEYKEKKLKIILSSKIKANLYLFLKKNKEKLISSSVYFEDNKNIYELEAYVTFSK